MLYGALFITFSVLSGRRHGSEFIFGFAMHLVKCVHRAPAADCSQVNCYPFSIHPEVDCEV